MCCGFSGSAVVLATGFHITIIALHVTVYEVTKTEAQWCLRSHPDFAWTLCHCTEGLSTDLSVHV